MENPLSFVQSYPATTRLVEAVVQEFPEHKSYLVKSFRDRSDSTNKLAENTAALIFEMEGGDLGGLVSGYRWICKMIMEEELYFRREGKYRHTSFVEVNAAVYQNSRQMGTYMDGLLATEVLWAQHARCMDFYVNTFLPKLPNNYRHLEVGPGHGILFYYAALDLRCGSLTGWDISPASLEQTARCLSKLGVARGFELMPKNVMEEPPAPMELYDSVVISEVLEHLENPSLALRNLSNLMSRNSRIFVNVPVNAPTIDHIFHLRSPEEAVDLVEKAGFIVDEVLYAPVAGCPISKARRIEGSVSVAISARPAWKG